MNALDWTYIAEGGKHAIFTYDPQQPSDIDVESKFHGQILRIQKRQLVKTVSQGHNQFCCYNHNRDGSFECDHTKGGRLSKTHSFISHILSRYVDNPTPIEVSFDFVHHLYVKTINEHVQKRLIIPNSRQKDWFISESGNTLDLSAVTCHACKTTPIKASLQHNYRHISNQSHLLSKNQFKTHYGTLSIEIKPKAGYISYSPLIQSKNIVKFFHTRFEILQQLYERNIITKGWASSSSSSGRVMSNYNPIDLFSDQLKDKERAIKHLFECPQNNLKVYYNDILLYGDRKGQSCKSDIDVKAKFEILDTMFPSKCSRSDSIKDQDANLQKLIQELTANILHQHMNSLLHNVVILQKAFDYLDIDGAIIIYQKLVDLCNGSFDEADSLIDSDTMFLGKSLSEADKIMKCNEDGMTDLKLHLTSGSESVATYLNLTEEFHNYLIFQRLAGANLEKVVDNINGWHNRALDSIEQFDKNDCIGVLQSWLMSLMMCDVSFILTVSCSNRCLNTDHIVDTHNRNREDKNNYFTFYSNPSAGNNMVMTTDGYLFEYQIKIIDIDGKPAYKLREKCEDKMEQTIKQFRSSKLNIL